ISVDIVHTAATPVGAEVVATATLRGREGGRFVFDVSARDPAGEIGRGTHRRAVVDAGRLVMGASRRVSGA
ncbi:MAG TPA: thioesterase, partial [Casimicrobiaceae bacterium]